MKIPGFFIEQTLSVTASPEQVLQQLAGETFQSSESTPDPWARRYKGVIGPRSFDIHCGQSRNSYKPRMGGTLEPSGTETVVRITFQPRASALVALAAYLTFMAALEIHLANLVFQGQSPGAALLIPAGFAAFALATALLAFHQDSRSEIPILRSILEEKPQSSVDSPAPR